MPTIKNKGTTPPFYNWEQSKHAADKLALWAYAKILNPESPHAKQYPINGTLNPVLPDGTWGLKLKTPKKTRPTKRFSDNQEIFRQGGRVQHALKRDIQNAEKFIARLKATSHQSNAYYQNHPFYGWMIEDLGRLINNAMRLLADLAETKELNEIGKRMAIDNLRFSAHVAASVLQKFSNRDDLRPIVQAIAEKESQWPVLYSPHLELKKELEARMKLLGVGKKSVPKVINAKWQIKPSEKRSGKSGDFARRMGWMLWEIHSDPALRLCLCRHAAAPLTFTGEIVLDATRYNVEAAKGSLTRTPDACSPELWEKRLVAQGWPRWIVRLHQLPELTKKSAPNWFEVGWEALQEATGGDVTKNLELATLGKSNADWARSRATGRGKTGAQKSRAESQIKKVLRTAFLRRFGNPKNFQNTEAKLVP